MNKIMVLWGVMLLSVSVSGYNTCGSTLSLLNFRDVSVGDWINASVYNTINPAFVGIRDFDFTVYDPTGTKVYMIETRINDTNTVINTSFYISNWWVDGGHKFNATLTILDAGNLNTVLCQQTSIVDFNVDSNRTAYTDNIIIDFKPIGFNSLSTSYKMMCFGGFCYNMTIKVPFDMNFTVDTSTLNPELPADWNTTDYYGIIQPTSLVYNYSFVAGLYQITTLNARQVTLCREEGKMINDQNVNLMTVNQNLTNQILNLSSYCSSVIAEKQVCDSRSSDYYGYWKGCEDNLNITQSTMYSTEEAYIFIVAGGVAMLVILVYIGRKKSETPDQK